ncbi:SpoIID/LytB domain-containing protein [Alkaliphilus peptidifermentans]|uniref:Stage II sporulation protein D n=1 Tax=Alkaliphilus peptidifermentans DSM 18978 TaxID=1120976 RepID=A0A1G5L4H3_9FIRM|nr:SpoIID/LytB domain-containing protein [Alkaliphilus peptidifermentans]SCZ07361.1 stage II sporulation protein D [Alkaliphilus peptidifermentans DSM 18978]
MKKTKKMLIMILIICMWSTSLIGANANEKPVIPQYIEIGLHFGSSAKSVTYLKSTGGFIAGTYNNDSFQQLVVLQGFNELILRKDAYYINSGGSFVEYTGNVGQAGNLNLQGPYHVQVGGSFDSKDSAEAFMDTLQVKDTLYLAFEGEWKVFGGLYIDEAKAEKRAEEIKSETGLNTKAIVPSSKRVQVLDKDGTPIFVFDSQSGVYIKAFNDKGEVPLINLEGRNFRGAITAKRMDNNDMAIINKLLLEEYLYGVVPKEMTPTWAPEALKAQAVAARGFAITSMTKYLNMGFNLCSTISSQVYEGYDIEHPNTNRAVDETKNKIITHNGKAVTPFYHSNSGGQTENSENIWSAALDYIKGKKDDYSLDAPNSNWTIVMSKEEVTNALNKEKIDVGEIIDIKITEASSNGRVLKFVVTGTKGEEVLEKQRSRAVLGLKSSYFSLQQGGETTAMVRNATSQPEAVNIQGKHVISESGTKKVESTTNINVYNGKSYKSIKGTADTFVFEGRGYGHGLGMSQYGAKRMAEMNYTYEEILTFYYTDIKVE